MLLVLAGASLLVTVESNMGVAVLLTLVCSSVGPLLVPLKQKVSFKSLKTLLGFKPPGVSVCC